MAPLGWGGRYALDLRMRESKLHAAMDRMLIARYGHACTCVRTRGYARVLKGTHGFQRCARLSGDCCRYRAEMDAVSVLVHTIKKAVRALT